MTDQPTTVSSLEEAWKDHRATIDATLPVVLNQARRDFNAGWAAARAEAIREVEALKGTLDGAYRERAQMAVALARLFPSWVNIDPDEPEWPVLYVQLPTGQASWHFSPADRDLLDGIAVGGEPWDGHTTEEKYARLRALSQGGEGKA